MKKFILYLGIICFASSVLYAALGDLALFADGTKVIWPSETSGVLVDEANLTIVLGFFPTGDVEVAHTSVGFNAGKDNRGNFVAFLGSSAGIHNTADNYSAFGSGAGGNNEGDDNSAFGSEAFNLFTNDTGGVQEITSVDFANNQVTIVGGHNFGANGEFRNLKASTTGTLPAGLGVGPDMWEIISSTVLECVTDSFTDAGTGTHELTPQLIFTNSTALGFDAEPDASNQVMLGDLNVTEVKTAGGMTLGGTLDMTDNPIVDVGYIDFNLLNGIAQAEGRLVWNDDDGTLNLGLPGGTVNLQIGQESVIRAKNTSGSTIGDGKAVRITGGSGNFATIGLSEADVPATAGSIGLTTESIDNNQFGYVTTFGLVRDVDTSSFAVGNRLFVSNTAGELTATPPSSDERIVFMGSVIVANLNTGIILVHPINVSYLSELSGNTFAGEAANDIMQYDGTIWENRSSLTVSKNIIHIPSAVASITAAGGITVTNAHMRIEGDGGPIDITANPQIAAGIDGQVLILEGHSNTNTVLIEQGDGIHMFGGNIRLGNHDVISFQYDTDSVEWQEITSNSTASEKSWSFMSRDAGSGTSYIGGKYKFHNGTSTFVAPATFGTANLSYAAHAFLVCDSSPASDSIIRVSGTSITDSGVRTGADTEDLTFLSTASANDYKETPKKWLGQITFTFISGDNTVLYNRGFCKYWDNNNTNYQVIGFEATWLGAKNDANPDIKILHHRPAGWTFTGTTPTPPAEIASMATDHNPEKQIGVDQEGAWKRDNLFEDVDGSADEGIIIELVTTTNRTYAIGNFMVRVRPK